LKHTLLALLCALTSSLAVGETFVGVDGAEIAYERHDDEMPGPSIVMLLGYGESMSFYEDLIEDFRGAGYGVFVMDHRGMGRSKRLASNPQIVHVDKFDDYVADAQTFVNTVVPRDSRPLHLFAHSTGGLVALNLMAREPDLFTSAVLSAPLIEIQFGTIPGPLARLIVNVADMAGYADHYAPGYDDISVDQFHFADNDTTHDEANFNRRMDLYRTDPHLLMGGPSNRWVAEVMRATDQADALRTKVTVPLLFLQAGDDRYVDNDSQKAFCDAAPSCRLEVFPESFHEIFTERSAVRQKALAATLTHLQRPKR
jgi:lysophospholipase